MDRPQVEEASLAQEPATTELTKRQILLSLAEAQGLGFLCAPSTLSERTPPGQQLYIEPEACILRADSSDL